MLQSERVVPSQESQECQLKESPNFSVARLLGLCLLQELNNFSDQQALDEFSFDIRWRYALDVGEEEDYPSRRSLVEFRRRLAAKDPEMKLI